VNGRFALGPEVKRSAITGGAMLYDTSRAGNLSADWFEPRYWESLGALDGSGRLPVARLRASSIAPTGGATCCVTTPEAA